MKSLSKMTVLGVRWKNVQLPQSSENNQVVSWRLVGGVIRDLRDLSD